MLAPQALLAEVVKLVDAAAVAAMEHYDGNVAVTTKPDASPVTAADEAAEAVLTAGLRDLTPDVPVVAEEEVAQGGVDAAAVGATRFWLVDPLDGTKEFIQRNGEFTLNVGLVEAGRPVLGVVSAPAIATAWWGANGLGATVRTEDGSARVIAVRTIPAAGPSAMVSRSHGSPDEEAFLAEEGVAERVAAGSSLKFCRIAEGIADLYPRFGRTMEWDTCAGDAVLRAAGGRVTTRSGEPLTYGKAEFANNGGFIARGG